MKKKRGPPHNPSFEIEVSLKGIRQFSATAKTIKDAEINAAKKMVDYILKNKLLNNHTIQSNLIRYHFIIKRNCMNNKVSNLNGI